MEDTAHFAAMLRGRGIKRSWVESAVLKPDKAEEHPDGTRHSSEVAAFQFAGRQRSSLMGA